MSKGRDLARNALLRLTNPRLLWLVSRRASFPIRRILLVRPDHLGDLLFATPALRQIRQAFPSAHITGLVGPWGRAMWEGNPSLDALETLRFPGIAGGKEGGTLGPYFLLRSESVRLERRRYDLGIVLRSDHWWGAALLAAARIPHRWGYDTPGMAEWLTRAVSYTAGRHEVEQDLSIAESAIEALAPQATPPATVNREQGVPPLHPPPAEPLPAGRAEFWLPAERRAVIHPGTASWNKLWTIEGWAEVVRRLAQRGWAVCITGSPQEKPLADAIERSAGALHPALSNLAGSTTGIPQLVGILQAAHLVLGVDSGPLHMAAALDKPTLHLYGPSDERIWGPWGDPRRHVALRAPGTKPTHHLVPGLAHLEGGPEMRAITVEMVMDCIDLLSQY